MGSNYIGGMKISLIQIPDINDKTAVDSADKMNQICVSVKSFYAYSAPYIHPYLLSLFSLSRSLNIAYGLTSMDLYLAVKQNIQSGVNASSGRNALSASIWSKSN